ncbi:MAG: hypothetical protein KIT84_01510 [Labilithrix sp.]|nr:hypothetical protein [Labilithrix sp.]MCW5809664.1 hypothetical protein [Labilithrix sp.]
MTARWVRFLRVFVAVLAFFAARPAVAAPPVLDAVVLVADATRAAATIAEADSARDETATQPPPPRPDVTDKTAPACPPALALAPFVLVPRKYLRNCSLLR